MRCFTAVVLASLTSLSLSGCQLLNRFTGGQQTEEEVTEVVPVPAETEPAAEDEEFEEPLVSAAPDAAAIARADLIQSTNPSERVQQINRSRSNPYETIPVPPPPTAAPPPPTAPSQPASAAPATPPTANLPPVATAPGGSGPGGAAAQPGGGATPGRAATPGGGATQPRGAAPGGGQPGNGGNVAALPQLPSTDLASAVQVSGVVRVGSENYAILNAPTEPTSRYVRVGQRIANNRVLVKRIEFGGGEPQVILEQNGIEVARPVGGMDDSMEEETPTAALEVPPQVINNVAIRPQR